MYSLFHIHSYNSLLDGFGSPLDNAKRAKQLNIKALSLSDHGTISGLVEHHKACKKVGIKSIKGCELYITHRPANIKTPENRDRTHMVIWSKNKQGWYDLIKLISQTNHPDYFYYKPRIYPWNFTDESGNFWPGLEHFCNGNIQGCSGHHGSLLSDNLFCDLYGDPKVRNEQLKKAYGQYKDVDTQYYRQFLKPNWLESTCELALKLQDVFKKGNFWIELQDELDPQDKLALWIHPLMVECLRKVSKETGIPSFASSDPHYPTKEDAEDQRATVMVAMKETEQSVEQKLSSSDEMDLMVFFGSSNFYIHSYDEMSKKFTKEELDETNKIADQTEEYDISEKPYIPKFTLPQFDKDQPYLKSLEKDEDKYLLYICVQGLKNLKPWETSGVKREVYWERLKEETAVIAKFGLSDYFLVVHDICMAADYRPQDHSFSWSYKGGTDPIARGVGRGSAANCLISYSCGITGIDPVKHALLFSRFFNTGRMSKDNIALPDIDLDFDVEGRDWILNYIRNKYGQENVGQIITFQTMKGKAAIKDIFRIKNFPNGFEIANQISENIVAEHIMADDIEHIKQDGDEDYNILRWTLDNSKGFQEWYAKPEIKPLLDQAMRCEGVKRGSGKHPSGIVVANKPLKDLFPLAFDTKTKERIVGFDLKSSETLGACKIDILGVAVLSKLALAEELINNG